MNSTVIHNRGVPYIGVTDFTTHDQVFQALEVIPKETNRRLHVGHMMSYKTYHGIPTQMGWEHMWLRGEELQALFQPHPKVFNVLHFADYSQQPCLTEAADLISACKEAGPNLQGLQLDMLWPRRSLVEQVKSEFPDLEIILQLGKVALTQLEESRGFIDLEIMRYANSVDYFLIDWGMGKGEPIDTEIVSSYVEIACELISQKRVAIAGGLGPSTYNVLQQFLEKYPSLSCDAQGQMRSTGKATDPIEMDRVCAYIQGVCSLLR